MDEWWWRRKRRKRRAVVDIEEALDAPTWLMRLGGLVWKRKKQLGSSSPPEKSACTQTSTVVVFSQGSGWNGAGGHALMKPRPLPLHLSAPACCSNITPSL
jgi:hypothetical protein